MKGDSGAWVVGALTGNLHGIVIAMDEEAGTTYMLRALDVVDDIRRVTKGLVTFPRSLRETSTNTAIGLSGVSVVQILS